MFRERCERFIQYLCALTFHSPMICFPRTGGVAVEPSQLLGSPEDRWPFNVLECIDRYVSIYVCSMIRCLRLAALISDVQMGQLIGCVRV